MTLEDFAENVLHAMEREKGTYYKKDSQGLEIAWSDFKGSASAAAEENKRLWKTIRDLENIIEDLRDELADYQWAQTEEDTYEL